MWWHDVGYGGQDIQEWKPLDYCLKFPGLIEDYQAVTLKIACLAPTQTLILILILARTLTVHPCDSLNCSTGCNSM